MKEDTLFGFLYLKFYQIQKPEVNRDTNNESSNDTPFIKNIMMIIGVI